MLNKAVINLNNLRSNATLIKNKLGTTKLCAVVKADAYGHGAVACANALYDIADCFAVALVEEGVELRYGGIDKEILVLVAPFRQDIKRALEYSLTLTVESLAQLKAVVFNAQKMGVNANVHIKVNCGMNRQGLDEISQLVEIMNYACQNYEWVTVQGIYSHFAAPQDKKALNATLDKFLLAIKTVKGYNKNIVCHISASGGFLNGVYMDMVRIGIMLYGYPPFKTDRLNLKRVMQIYAPVLKIRRLKKGQGCMYGNYRLTCDKAVALIRYGYADGLPRRQVQRQVNNRCMDVTAIDLQDGMRRGDYALVLDDAECLAEQYQTISYEILTKAAIRAERIYIN